MNLKTNACTALILTGCLFLGSCTGLGSYWPAGSNHVPGPGIGMADAEVQVSISVGEARQMAQRHGLTGARSLPPGIARNLARGKPLPPGIARQVVPGGMLNDLPRIPDHEWRIAGRDLILIAVGTLIVTEILENVFE